MSPNTQLRFALAGTNAIGIVCVLCKKNCEKGSFCCCLFCRNEAVIVGFAAFFMPVSFACCGHPTVVASEFYSDSKEKTTFRLSKANLARILNNLTASGDEVVTHNFARRCSMRETFIRLLDISLVMSNPSLHTITIKVELVYARPNILKSQYMM